MIPSKRDENVKVKRNASISKFEQVRREKERAARAKADAEEDKRLIEEVRVTPGLRWERGGTSFFTNGI